MKTLLTWAIAVAAMVLTVVEVAHSATQYVERNIVNLRAGPSTTATIVGKLRFRDVVETLRETSGGWVKVKAADKVGWVYSPLLSKSRPPVKKSTVRAKLKRMRSSWRTVDSFRVHGELLGLEDPADVVFDILTPDYRVAEPDVVRSGDGMKVTHHFKVGGRYIDITFARSFGQYRVIKIRVKE